MAVTYPPPYDPPSNDPLRKRDPSGDDQSASGPPPADPGFTPQPDFQPTNFDYGQQYGQQQYGQQPGYQQPGFPGVYGAPVSETNSNAIIALVCGIGAFVICGLGAIPAIIFGNRAIAEIDASGGRQDGRGMAQAGKIIGWVAVAMWVIGIVLFALIFIAAAASSST
ncbi:hypothetical protein BFL43_05935 [Williamsia sp. 1135]|nr:hypothetical protein BFL43_05935 [Williamsia sp. 1135]